MGQVGGKQNSNQTDYKQPEDIREGIRANLDILPESGATSISTGSEAEEVVAFTASVTPVALLGSAVFIPP